MKRLFGRTRRFGMTEKNRRRLAVFRDPQLIRDLLLLPYRLLKRAESGSLPPKAAAKLVRAAVAVELEIMCPIRLQNLSEINVDTDFVRSHAGKNAAVHLFIPGKRTKNGEDIELELPRESMALIDLYLAKYRNHLIEPQYRSGPRLLFPRQMAPPRLAGCWPMPSSGFAAGARHPVQHASVPPPRLLPLPAQPSRPDRRDASGAGSQGWEYDHAVLCFCRTVRRLPPV